MTQTQGPVCGMCHPPRPSDLTRGPATTIHLCPGHQQQHGQLMARLADLADTMVMVERTHAFPHIVHADLGP
ncbi:hypothetical protein ABZS66_19160 [Dactylosporangium sp. NPDC005572]|uniref:hypothetical protein n=1 Tax=Dactylosporangium sp. NPDC005572 TaxID=3156889 RepID=UPI0033A8536F